MTNPRYNYCITQIGVSQEFLLYNFSIMLKKLAMLVILTIAAVGILPGQNAPANPPEHRIGETNSSHSGGNQPQPYNSEQTPPNAVPSARQPSTPACDESCEQGRQNIAIQRKLVWFTFGLVVVGFLQVGTMVWQAKLLRETRDEVHTQAEQMRTQAGHMEAQLKEMKAVSEIQNKTLILQYRPRIIVRNAKETNSSYAWGEPWELDIRFEIVNIGGTMAQITGGFIQIMSAIGHDLGKIELKEGIQCEISPSTLEPGENITVVIERIPTGVHLDSQWENFNQGIPLPLRAVYLAGNIRYLDDLKIPRNTGLHRRFDPKTREFVPVEKSEQEYSD